MGRKSIRYEKYVDPNDGITYWRMYRAIHGVMVVATPIELEIGRDVVARNLRRARAHLRWMERDWKKRMAVPVDVGYHRWTSVDDNTLRRIDSP
jgi:hypothetical protein